MKILLLFLITAFIASAQRITTIQLDGVQYFVSRMNPYSPELNYFLAYQYCRSLGLQLASFETKEKADTMTEYLINAGYKKYEFWTSGNKLGTDMFLWMSTGLPFNSTFDYMHKKSSNRAIDVPPGTEPQRVARESGKSSSADSCVAMVPPTLDWEVRDCSQIKDFICEQTRCYYYNYGSIPVSATQGNRKPYLTTTTTASPTTTEASTTLASSDNSEHQLEPENPSDEDVKEDHDGLKLEKDKSDDDASTSIHSGDSVVGRLMSTVSFNNVKSTDGFKIEKSRTEDIPDITTLFTSSGARIKTPNTDNSFISGLNENHDIHIVQRQNDNKLRLTKLTSVDNSEDSTTIGPYGSSQDYVNDEPENIADDATSNQEDASTILPDEAVGSYRYNIKVRSNGKVLDPPSN